MKKIVFILILLFITQNLFGGTGSSTASFLLLDQGAANIGIGGIPNYFSKNIDLLNYNPAMVSYFKHIGASVTYADLIIGDKFINVTGIFPALSLGVFGFKFAGIFYGDIEGTIISGYEYEYLDRSVSARDIMVGFNYAYPFSKVFAAGIKAEFLTGTLDTESYVDFAFDTGVTINPFSSRFFSGLSLKNIGPNITYTKEEYNLPMLLDFTAGYKILDNYSRYHDLIFFSSLNILFSENIKWKLGLEYSFFDLISIRSGYRLGYDTSNLTFGLGINYAKSKSIYKIDFGFLLNSYIGSTYIVSAQISCNLFSARDSALRIKREKPKRAEPVKEDLFKTYYNKALNYYGKGDYDNASANIQKALSQDPASKEAIKLQIRIGAGVLFYEGVAEYELEEFDFAIKNFKRALELDPELEKARQYLIKAEKEKMAQTEKEKLLEEKPPVEEEKETIPEKEEESEIETEEEPVEVLDEIEDEKEPILEEENEPALEEERESMPEKEEDSTAEKEEEPILEEEDEPALEEESESMPEKKEESTKF